MDYKVIPIPCLKDNFAFIIVDQETKYAAAVDAVGGNEEMAKIFPTAEFVAGEGEGIPGTTKPVKENDVVFLGKNKFSCIFAPCHTSYHMLYYLTNPNSNKKTLFSGDTIFTAGCGRFFEGNAENMHQILNQKIRSLPLKTKIYCGHDYLINNLKFALVVEPKNSFIKKKLEVALKATEKERIPMVFSKLEMELKMNPFMRLDCPEVMNFAGRKVAVEVMSELRRLKNCFKC